MRLPGAAFFLTAFVVLALDQGTKAWIRDTIPPWESIPGLGPFQLTHIFNTGAAFGIFPDQTIVLTVIVVTVCVAIVVFGRSLTRSNALLTFALGLILGGAVGNLLDRIALGHVTDFVDLRSPAGENLFPLFNVADAAVVCGVILLIAGTLFLDRKPAPAGAPPPDAHPPADRRDPSPTP